MKYASYIWVCAPWARWCQHLCSIVDSVFKVIVWLSISWCMNLLSFDLIGAIDGDDLAFHFGISGNYLSNVGTNLSLLKYKRSFCTLYVLLIYQASLHTSFIRSPYTFSFELGP